MELFIIFAAFIVATIISSLVKQRGVVEFFSVAASAIGLFGALRVALQVAATGSYTPVALLHVDALGAIVLLVIFCVGFVAAIYSIAYLRMETSKNIIGVTRVRQYFILFNLFSLAMLLAVTANNPIFAWIAIEATTLSTAFLISFYDKPSAIEAAWKYLIINSIGLLLGFFGTLMYFTSVIVSDGGAFMSWQALAASAAGLDSLIAKIAFIFVLIGYGTKVGFVPMHTWKPDAYSKAPNPIGALLSGALLPIAFITLLKFKSITDAVVGPQFSQQLLIVFGTLSIVVAALIMLNAKNYKRLLAYSSIENAGLMALGFGFGGMGAVAAILHLIYHSLVKGVMFFSSGNLLLKYHSAKIGKIKGALSVLPTTSVLFIAGFLVVTGVPPFGMFVTKLQILSAGIQAHPAVSIIALAFMALIFISFLKHSTAMFFGEPPKDVVHGEGGIWLLIPPVLLLAVIIMLSFYIPPFLASLLHDAAALY